MRVLCLYSNSYGGGTESVLLNGLPVLHRVPGIEVTFGDIYSRTAVTRKFTAAGLPIRGIGDPNSPSVLSSHRGLWRKRDIAAAVPRHLRMVLDVRRALEAYDVLYVHGYKDLAVCQAACLGGRRRPPVVWHCHGISSDLLPPMLRVLANRCARLIATSEDVRKGLLASGIPSSRVRTIYNSVDTRRICEAGLRPPIQPVPASANRKIVLLCPASIRPDKGLHLAIRALPALSGDVDLWITGDQSDPAAANYVGELMSLAQGQGVRERVSFVGFRADLPALISLAQVVCVPSICREGFGLVAAEAMALGKPVVVSSRGALVEVVANSGLIFDPDQPGDLSRKLSAVLGDPSLAKSMGDAGQQTVRQRFSYERWAREVAAELLAVGLSPGHGTSPAGEPAQYEPERPKEGRRKR